MLTVRKNDGSLETFNKSKIIESIRKETGCEGKIIEQVVDEVEHILLNSPLQIITGPLIREVVNSKFLEHELFDCRKKYTRVGMPVYDARRIDIGGGKGDNANLQDSPETGHKRKADQLSKEQYLLTFPDHIAEAHLNGDIHIHDLEYFGSRQFCLDGSVILPYMSNGYMRTQRLDEFRFDDSDCFYPTNMQVFNPGGLKTVRKITRRKVGNDQLIKIVTSDGRSVKVTKEHQLPRFNDGYDVVLAKDLNIGDMLQPLNVVDYTFDSNITQINLLTALIERVPNQHLDTVYVRNIRPIYDYIKMSCNYKSYTEMATDLGISLSQIKSGISRINDFYNLVTTHKIDNFGDAVISCVGNSRCIPIRLNLTQSLMYILGAFVGDGNYNVDLESHSYNLVISNTAQNNELCSRINDLGSFYTINIATNGGKQVYFGGKMWYLLFKYVFCIPEYAQHKRIPDIVYNTTSWLRQSFVEGMFSTDSGIHYDPADSSCQIVYHTTSEDLRQEIIILLSQYGIKTSFYEVERTDDYSTLYRIVISGWDAVNIFAENFTLLERKQDHINAFLKSVSPIYRTPVGCNVKKLIECNASSDWVYDVFLERSDSDIDHCYYAGDGLLVHNCLDSDLRYFFYYGFVGDGTGDHTSFAAPAKRPEVAVLHAVKVLGSSQTNCAGGQGFYNFLTFLAPYFKDCSYDIYRQCMQLFVYEMTQMLVARGGQVVFSSVQLSPGIPELWKDIPAVYKGNIWDGQTNPLHTYGMFEKENRLLFKALMEVIIEGDYKGKPFYFPKPEISIEPQFIEMMKIEDEIAFPDDYPSIRELYLLSFKLASKFGTPYFDNQIPQYRGAGKGISCFQCCMVEDTLIQVVRDNTVSIIPIKELTHGDLVVTPHGHERFETILVQDVDTEVYEVTLRGGRRFTGTVDHKLPILGNDEFVELKDLKIGDDVFVNCTLPSSGTIPRFFPEQNDVEFCYLIGLFAAEGSSNISPDGTNRHLMWCYGAHESDLINKTCKIVRSVFGYIAKVYDVNNCRGKSVNIHSNKIHDWFAEIGVPLKGRDMIVPSFILNAPIECKWAFINGYYRGDGCLRKNGKQSKVLRIEMNTISRPLAEGLLLLLGSVGYDFHYNVAIDKRPNRKPRHILTLNKASEVKDFFACNTKSSVWESPVSKIVTKPYVGYVYDPVEVTNHTFITAQGIVSSNCAYCFSSNEDSDDSFTDKLHFKDGAHFSMGSYQVMTVNFPRLAYEALDASNNLRAREIYFEGVAKMRINLCCEVFKLKREMLKSVKAPFLQQSHNGSPHLVDFDSLVYTVGVIGINEVCEILYGKQLHESVDVQVKAMTFIMKMKQYCAEKSKEYGFTIAFARTPAETTAQRFAVLDLLNYGDAHKFVKGDVVGAIRKYAETGSRDLPIYYTNGTHVPVDAGIPLAEKIRIEQAFFPILDGGNICNIYLGEQKPDPRGLMDMTLRICKSTNLGYFAFTRDFTVCNNGYRHY